MQTALKSLPESQSNDWSKFCAMLSTEFGQIDPDAEFWDQMENLRQGSLPVLQYLYKMHYCFNGITELPLSNGEKIHRFLHGLNPKVKEKVVTAPYGTGDKNGKWVDPDELMRYTVMHARALLDGDALHPSVPAGQKGPSGGDGSAGKKNKHKYNNAGSLSGVLIPLLLYADDLTIMSTTAAGLQRQLDALQLFCKQQQLSVNLAKTKVVTVGSSQLPSFQIQWQRSGARSYIQVSGI